MYSKELRMRAIELYIKFEKSPADVIRELGYPDRKTLGKWYKMYLEEQESGVPYEKRFAKVPSFSQEEQEVAVRHYLKHGRNFLKNPQGLGISQQGDTPAVVQRPCARQVQETQ